MSRPVWDGLCRICGVGPLPPRRPWHEGPSHAGRGLCVPDYRRAARNGTLLDFPVFTYDGPSLVADALIIRARQVRDGNGVLGPTPWRQVADQLGVKRATLEKARERAGWPDVEPSRYLAPGKQSRIVSLSSIG